MKKMGMVVIICTLAAFLAGCAPTQPRAVDYDQVGPKDKLILRFSYVTGVDTPKGLAARKFKELVEKRSGGKVEVQLFPNATLYSDQEELSELKQGEVQLIAPAISKLSDIVPEVQMFDLPYIFREPQEVWKLVDGPLGQELNQLLEQQGYKVLGVWDNGFKQITNDQHLVKTSADMRNMTIRIMNSSVLAHQFATVGARTEVMPFDQLYSALEEEKIDGEENTFSNIYSQKLYKSQKYITKSDHGYLGYFVLANKKFWDDIPRPTRELLDQTLAEVTKWERKNALTLNQKQYEELKERKDVHIYELSASEKEQWKQSFRSTYWWFTNQISNGLMRDYMNHIIEQGLSGPKE